MLNIIHNNLVRALPNYANQIYRLSGKPMVQKRWVSDSGSYDGDGKTTVVCLNNIESELNLIDTYSDKGFRLSNRMFVAGSILVFPTAIYAWNVKQGKDINLDSLTIFDLVVPKAKIVIIGYGEQGEPYDGSIALNLKKRGISCEMLPTKHAVTTYNFLVSDAVHVAGAFIPVRRVVATERDNEALIGYDQMTTGIEFKERVERDPLSYYKQKSDELGKDRGKTKFD